jgi:hypothetical protein
VLEPVPVEDPLPPPEPAVAVLSCGDVVTEWSPPPTKPGATWRTTCVACEDQRRVVREIHPNR